ncbi:MAG: phosphatidylserine decarboxylase family protein [Bacteroidetes bacterium]|nr:phosphatidylserine decarboxylase family protein [Bacteroidota bacterium]MDA0879436.1 phosphatidylserine decarboxylase family protein [Bacteroidota bacterium]MDA1115419.1 phosphatidylserine decarboxylase family protein [Bacteroidota bacterium]
MFHKEGYKIITVAMITAIAAVVAMDFYILDGLTKVTSQLGVLIFLVLILQFFRNPKREITWDVKKVFSPVDGKVVVIETVYEDEFFKADRKQISIFMSPINVHVTRYPVSGEIIYSKYHPGKYLVAWHPKSSTLNERTTVVVKSPKFGPVLFRQIAGALARRIVNYAKIGEVGQQGSDSGFIKFGSRVDVFLPLDAIITVKPNQKVIGAKTVIAEYNETE